MSTPVNHRIQQLAKDFRERGVVRAAIVYGSVVLTGLGVLDLLRDLVPWLDRVFPVLVLGAVSGFPVVLVLAWVFDVGSHGIRVHQDPAQGRASVGYRLGAGVGVALASGVFGWTILTLWDWSEARPVPSEIPELDPTRVAVLYFDDHSPGGELGFLANGLTEDLINQLANVDALRVTSRNGVKPFREDPPGVREIARRLSVGTVVEGSVTGDAERVRVTVQLIDGRTDEHLMSRQFDAEQGDLLQLQDDLAEAISGALRQRLGISIREEEERGRTDDPRAWATYHEGRRVADEAAEMAHDDPRLPPWDLFGRADSLLALAALLDPSWPDPPIERGWTAMAASIAGSENVGFLQPGDSTVLRELAESAVSVSDRAPAALELRGAVAFELAESLGGRDDLREQAEADLVAALRADPDRAQTLAYLSEIRRQAGDFVEARHYAERALVADAFYEEAAEVKARLFDANVELKDWAAADRWCRVGRRDHPEDTDFVLCRLFLVSLRPGTPAPAEAWAAMDTLRQETGAEDWEYQYRSWAGYRVARVLARNGLKDSTKAVLERYRASDEIRPWLAYDEADVHLVLGEPDTAMDLLELYLTVRPDRASYLARDWAFEELRDRPRFREITGTN
jgi:TolB-like protein